MSVEVALAYTGPRMARRLAAFALAIVVTGAPIATDLCEAACAARSAEAAANPTAGGHHSCHPEPPASGPSVIAVHACGHTDRLPGGDRPEPGTAALATLPALTVVAPASDVALAVIVPGLFASPPLTALTSQLRV